MYYAQPISASIYGNRQHFGNNQGGVGKKEIQANAFAVGTIFQTVF